MLRDGKPVTHDAADTSTWVRRDGQWRCCVHTETGLRAPQSDPSSTQ
jgi:hypothetical protein